MKRLVRTKTSKVIRFVIGISGILISSFASAAPAGVIPFACHDDSILILLAHDLNPERNGYASFGGGAHSGETIAETAAREFYEETNCAFLLPDAKALTALTPSISNGFYSYVAEVKYLEPLAIELTSCDAKIERAGWQWFELEPLRRALMTRTLRPAIPIYQSDQVVRLWDLGAQSLRQAEQDGLLSPDILCK